MGRAIDRAGNGVSIGGTHRSGRPRASSDVGGESFAVDLTGKGSIRQGPSSGARHLSVVETPLRRWRTLNLIAKATLDYVLGGVALILLAPLLLTIATLIWIDDRGPVFFLQHRVGRRGCIFRMVKFRTMVVDADESLHREHTLRLATEPAPLRMDEDPRITRVGSFLRRWSLDELPNLFNVFAGQMSLVGPRPLVTYEAGLLSAEECRRFEVKPGITGLAQVNGRLGIDPGERASFDIEYVDTQNVWIDLVVMAKTVPSMLRSQG